MFSIFLILTKERIQEQRFYLKQETNFKKALLTKRDILVTFVKEMKAVISFSVLCSGYSKKRRKMKTSKDLE